MCRRLVPASSRRRSGQECASKPAGVPAGHLHFLRRWGSGPSRPGADTSPPRLRRPVTALANCGQEFERNRWCGRFCGRSRGRPQRTLFCVTTPYRTLSTPEERLVYTVAEAGELLGISRAFAYELVARGDLPVICLGRRRLVPKAALLALVGQCQVEEPRAIPD
jgi:excisionase family DNA binding protein